MLSHPLHLHIVPDQADTCRALCRETLAGIRMLATDPPAELCSLVWAQACTQPLPSNLVSLNVLLWEAVSFDLWQHAFWWHVYSTLPCVITCWKWGSCSLLQADYSSKARLYWRLASWDPKGHAGNRPRLWGHPFKGRARCWAKHLGWTWYFKMECSDVPYRLIHRTSTYEPSSVSNSSFPIQWSVSVGVFKSSASLEILSPSRKQLLLAVWLV